MSDLTQYDYDIFMSHSTADQAWTARLTARLEQEEWDGRKIRVFFSPRDLSPGDDIETAIEAAIPRSRCMCVVMSPEAMASYFVKLEIDIMKEIISKGGKELLIPILRRECEVPRVLRKRSRINAKGPGALERTCRRIVARLRGEVLDLDVLLSPYGDVLDLLDFIPPVPPIGFIPRYNEQGQKVYELVREALAPGKNQLVALWGPGGMGKTTLAATLAREMYAAYKNRVVWVNANESANFSLTTLLDLVAERLGEADLRAYGFGQKEAEVKKVVNYMAPLIVLDNFETISAGEQQECLRWLKTGSSCSALIITKEKIDDPDIINIHIGKISDDDWRDYLRIFSK
jgi:hypothetical protein